MTKSHYKFKKRQNELKREKKKEAKRQRKLDQKVKESEENPDHIETDTDPQGDDTQADSREEEEMAPEVLGGE